MSDETIINFLRQNGPSTPAQLAKHVNTSLLFASAMLGEVSSKGVVEITNLKIGGGSPLYYLKEDTEKLVNFADKLSPKDKDAFELLKEKKVIRDKSQTPIIRVSLRTIKDFAVPLTIVMGENKELFWKWYLLGDKEAEEEIRKILGGDKPVEAPVVKEKPKIVPKPEAKSEPKPEVKTVKEKPAKVRETPAASKSLNDFGIGDMNADFLENCKGSFGKKMDNYFEEKLIKIENYEQIKKNKEYNFTLKVPSAIGSSRFFCKGIDKKKIGEGDLALALVEGQHKQLPVLFITTGALNKKTEEKVSTLFKDLNYIKI